MSASVFFNAPIAAVSRCCGREGFPRGTLCVSMRVLDPQSQEKDNAIFAAMTIDRAIEGQARNSGKPYDHAYEWGAFKTLKAQIKTYYSREGFK